jgi:hypothetical protein
LWTKIVSRITSIVNNEATERSTADNGLSARISSNADDIDRLATRVSAIEQLSTISVSGETVGIGTSADFITRTTAGDAKIPTVGAVADGLGVSIPKMV